MKQDHILMRILGRILGHFACRHLRAAGLLAMIAASPALAADMPKKAPAAEAFSWTGCYMGAHIGGVLDEDPFAAASGRSAGCSSAGFAGGGQIGCDYQFDSGWVVGGEGRVAGTTLKNNLSATDTNAATGEIFPSRFTFENDVL